jgi:hypothetical protein
LGGVGAPPGAWREFGNHRRGKNIDTVPFSPALHFEGPLGPPIHGADAVRAFLRGVFPVITGLRVLQMLCDGDYVAVRFELSTIYGIIPAFDWFHIVDGLITEARPYYDPRPITTATEAATR